MDLTPFKDLIKERCGLSFEEMRSANLSSGIRKRMALQGIESAGEYLSLLLSRQEEFNCLVNLLTINETYFFREPAHLELLTGRVLPPMLGRERGADKIRILSAGCSTGEEPYSLVMALMEKYGLGIRDFVSVIGVDIDGDALNKAKTGVFGPHSFRGETEKFKQKYFEALRDNRYRIQESVRERVDFRELNLLADSFPPEFEGFDIIFYRNVSIYFEPETRDKIFSKLASLLRTEGILFVSSTETISHDNGLLSLVEMEDQYFFCKDLGQKKAEPPRSMTRADQGVRMPDGQLSRQTRPTVAAQAVVREKPPEVVPGRGQAPAEGKDRDLMFDEAVSLARDKRYPKALEIIGALLKEDPGQAGIYVLKAGILLNLKKPEEAEEACLLGIEMDKWQPEAYLLLGLIARSRGDDERARKRFKEVLYISPSIWSAHYYLAEIYRAAGNTEAACREYEIVGKLLSKGETAEHGFTFFPFSVSPHQVGHLCKHNISLLKQKRA
jgi:chemotaxis protein methyltransferase CheR